MTPKNLPAWLASITALFLMFAALPAAASDGESGSEGSGSSGSSAPEPSSETASVEDAPDTEDVDTDLDDGIDETDEPDEASSSSGSGSGADDEDSGDNSGPGGDASNETEDADEDNEGPGSREDEEDDENETEDRSGPGGDDEADDDEDDDDEESRQVEIQTSPQEVNIQLKREADQTEDKLELALDVAKAQFEIELEHEDDGVEEELRLKATFLSLVEYRDENGNGRYDAGEALASAWDLSQGSEDDELGMIARPITWLEPTTQEIEVGGVQGQRIGVPATFNGTGHFELVLYAFGDFVDLNGSSLEPTSIKIDVVIRDYPYAVNDTALALIVKTEAKREQKTEAAPESLGQDEAGFAAVQSGNQTEVSLIFAWKEFAEVDGVNRTVNMTSIRAVEEVESSEWKRKEIFAFSYARGTNITHDPEVFASIQSMGQAVQVLGGPAGSWALAGLGALLVSVAVAVTLGPRMRAR